MEPVTSKELTQLDAAERCGNCYFFRVNPIQMQEGGCREDSIKLVIVPGADGRPAMAGQFPPTRVDLWCGKWRAKWPKGN